VRNVFFVLKMALDYGIKSGRIRVNPCAGVELPSARSPKMLFLTADDVAILATAVGARTVSHRPSPKTRPPFGLVVRFAAYTGLRAGEIVGLRVEDLNFLTRSVHVRRSVSMVEGQLREEAPKTAASGRIVGVPAALWAELVEYVGPRRDDPAGPVFLSHRGGPFNHNVFYLSYFKPAVREVLPKRLHGLRFHDLRHTYASLLVEMGAHPKEMAERLGHSSVQITLDRYAHLMPHMDAALTERLDDSYRGAVAKPAAALTEVRG
jgi:integrase